MTASAVPETAPSLGVPRRRLAVERRPSSQLYTFAEFAALLNEAGFRLAHRLEGASWLQAEVAG